jgi:hypothetical protein
MEHHVDDFFPLLREAIAEARSAGLTDLADRLESRALAAYTTSSELLGEIGKAILAFLQAGGESVPPSVAGNLNACLLHVQRVWPHLRT